MGCPASGRTRWANPPYALQAGQKLESESVIVRLTLRQSETDRESVGIWRLVTSCQMNADRTEPTNLHLKDIA
jgi:hypothetical protein